MTLRKDVEKKVKLQEFESTSKQFLSQEDRDYLSYSVKEYQTYKSVSKLMQSLVSCLDTPEKLDLLPLIRDLMIPKHDHKKFDSLAPYSRMAHPNTLPNPSGSPSSNSQYKTVKLVKRKGDHLGISIRGGKEYNLGIYISEVESDSIAEKSGLVAGDQIINANGISFENIMHSSAALVLRSHDDVVLRVKTVVGALPGGRLVRNSFIWVDPSGRHVREPGTPRQDDCKVVLHPDKKKSLGLSIRGGSEYQLGIYVSGIDSGSPADICGLKVGDQIVEVNGHSFTNILHKEAVTILKSYSPLMMTIKSLGIIPTLPEQIEEPAVTRQLKVSEKERKGEEEEEETDGGMETQKETTERKNVVSMSYDLVRGSPKLSSSPHVPKRDVSVKRSKSLRTPTNRLSMHSTPNLQPSRPRASSTGERDVRRSRSTIAVVSPLAVHAMKAEGAPKEQDKQLQLHQPTESANDEGLAEPSFFEPGLAGTQVMLAFATSQAEQLLMDESRRVLTESEMHALKDHLQEYKRCGNIKEFAEFLVALLESSEKARLFNGIRSVLHPRDISKYDKMVIPHELAVIKKHREASDDATDGYSEVLTDLQTNGPPKLRQVKDVEPKHNIPDLGPFKGPSAMNVLQKATKKEPLLTGVQTAESFIAWCEEEGKKPQLARSTPTPITVELQKGSPELGIEIEGGVNRGAAEIRVKELKPGGAASMNNLLIKPGCEIVEVDGNTLRGTKKSEALQILNNAYRSDRPTLKITIIPV